MLAAAIGAGMLLSFQLRRRQTEESGKDILIAFIITLPMAFIFARAYYCWCKPESFTSIADVMNFGNGGYGLLGGIVGMALGVVISARVLRVDAGELLDAFAPGLGLAIAIGRWGALFAGENLGGIVTAEIFQRMPFALYSENEGIYRRAFFVAESLIALLLTAAVLWLFRERYQKRSFHTAGGNIFMLFISVYFFIQGIYEQYRYDPLYFNTPYIQKLQTVSATLSLGVLLGAVPVAVMLLRELLTQGFKLRMVRDVIICGLSCFGYFNIVLRVDSVNELYNGTVLVFSAVTLSLMALTLFVRLIQPDVQKGAERNQPALRRQW